MMVIGKIGRIDMQQRERPVVVNGGYPQAYDGHGTRYLGYKRRQTGHKNHKPVYDPAGYTGRGIDVATEEKRLDIDKYIADNPAERTRYTAHGDSHPHRIAGSNRFLYADYNKQRQTDGVEYE